MHLQLQHVLEEQIAKRPTPMIVKETSKVNPILSELVHYIFFNSSQFIWSGKSGGNNSRDRFYL